MPRRGESIYKRADGRWEARYIHHYENGKAKYGFLYAKSYAEVKEKRLIALETLKHAAGTSPKQETKFGELSALWLEEIQSRVKESTYARYLRIVENYLNSHLADIPIVQLDCPYLKAFSQELRRQNGKMKGFLSAKTVNDILCVLKSIFRFGRENGYPCAEITAISYPVKVQRPTLILNAEKRRELEDRLLRSERSGSRDRVNLGILFALYTGVRIGELCGLRYGDIDFVEKTVSIQRTVERIPNLESNEKPRTKLVISEPKTNHSVRVIPLPSFLVEHLQKFAVRDSCYLLTGTEIPTEPHQFYLRYKTFMKRNGMEEYTFHALRHTFATRCVESGFDVKSLSEILGHANVSTTLAIYVHPTLEQKRRQMEMLTPVPRM